MRKHPLRGEGQRGLVRMRNRAIFPTRYCFVPNLALRATSPLEGTEDATKKVAIQQKKFIFVVSSLGIVRDANNYYATI